MNGSLPIHPAMKPETIYRRFFLAGILVVLTAGAAWGVLLLWQVANARSFTGVSIHAVNAHGHAQIFGWVGLFIMGFAYQAFPRMWRSPSNRVVGPHLAVAAFVMMVAGIGASTIGTFVAESWSMAIPLVTVGGLLQIVAVITFAGQMMATYWRSPESLSPAAGFMFMAILFFLAMTVMNLWHTLALMRAETQEALLAQIATYQAALRDLQVHGMAMFMILGVSMRFFPGMFGFTRTPSAQGWFALLVLTIAVIGEVVLLIAAQRTGSRPLMMMMISPWLLIFLGVGIIVLPWRLWRPLPVMHRSTKFIRTAYLWLGISILMLLAMPAYLALRASAHGLESLGFSHAYYGAVRHAITVGFVSLMIMGVAAYVVPNIRGRDHRALSPLWGPFILVNIGCSLRVSMQVLTDWHEAFYSMIAISGALELAGLAWWGVGLVAIMFGRRALPHASSIESTAKRAADIHADSCTCCGSSHELAATGESR